MALDFEKLKNKFSLGKKTSVAKEPAAEERPQKAQKAQKAWLNYPVVKGIKRGFEDIQVVAHEGKYSLFAKQVVFLLVVFLGVRFVCGKLAQSKDQIKDKIAAINIQQANKEDYLENKAHLLQLEPLFPDIDQKNDWMLRRLIVAFDLHKITPNVDGNVTETSEKTYTMLAQPVVFQQTFAEIGKLIADIENGDDFLRISSLEIDKLTGPEVLGENKVTVMFNTIFPKEKYAPKLFKDYAQYMKKKGQGASGQTDGGKTK